MHSDNKLRKTIKNLIRDDKKALDEIYYIYYPRLYRFSKSFLKVEDDINDLLQDVFVKIWLNRHKIEDVDTFHSWIFTITKNTIVSYFREKMKHRDFQNRVKQLALGEELELNADLEYTELKGKVEKVIGQLPKKRQQIFRLSREQGFTYREIAEKLQISTKTVEDHMLHSIRYLRENF